MDVRYLPGRLVRHARLQLLVDTPASKIYCNNKRAQPYLETGRGNCQHLPPC